MHTNWLHVYVNISILAQIFWLVKGPAENYFNNIRKVTLAYAIVLIVSGDVAMNFDL